MKMEKNRMERMEIVSKPQKMIISLFHWKKIKQYSEQLKELEILKKTIQIDFVEKTANVIAEIDENTIIFTDDAVLAAECVQKHIPYLFFLHAGNAGETLPSGAYCVESLLDVSYDYLDKVYRRAKNLPWDILETERLIVREITVADVPRLYELYKDADITRYMEGLFPLIKQEEDYTRDYIRNIYYFYGYGMWLIVLKETGEVIGRAGLEYKDGLEGLELGFMLGKDYQHKGYAYEACHAILDYAREELEQLSFRAVVHKENTSSRRLCEKLGFTNTGQTMQKEEDEYLEYCINKI